MVYALKEKWENVIGADKWDYFEACLSAVCTLFLKDNKNPLGLIIIGHSAGSKSTILNMFKNLPNGLTHHTDKFTPASFLTQATNVAKDKLQEIDLIRKLPNRVLLVPDLAPMFGRKEQDVRESLSILTRVMDGDGLSNDGGVQGHREFNEECVFVLLGAVVKITPAIWRIVSEMGTRLLFMRMDRINIHSSQNKLLMSQLRNADSFELEISEIRKLVHELISDRIENIGIRKVSIQLPDETELELISKISELVAKLRITVDRETGFEQNEAPVRVAKQLINILKGRAIVYGRDKIIESDIQLALHIALSSVSDCRGQIVKYAIEKCGEYIKLEEFVANTSFMSTKLREELNILTQIGILVEGKEGNANRWKLDDKWEDLALI